jgi:hypothetical protein
VSVDLERLPEDEEWLRTSDLVDRSDDQRAIQNVLDALNYYRCKAKFAEQELARAEAELTAIRESAEFGSWM